MMALGIIIPVLPKLILNFQGGNATSAAHTLGVFGTVWAAMQFICAPILGSLSDRFGRRPVLLLSMTGLGIDYVFMALAPTLRLLFVGRVISGMTTSSFSTASAYVADCTPPEKRAGRFGLLGAAFGAGFILGPALGGFLGGINLRAPFWASAALSLANALYGLFVLPESLPLVRRSHFDWRKANPIGSLVLLKSHGELLGIAGVYFLYILAHNSLPSMFVLYADYRYAWDGRTVGLVLSLVGVASMLVQGGLVGRVVRWFGERRTLLLGLFFGGSAFAIYGWAPRGALFLIGIPFGSLMGIVSPAVQTFMTRRVGPTEQGKLQGANGSVMGIAGMIAPTLFTQVFAFGVAPTHSVLIPGAPYLLASALCLMAIVTAAWVTRHSAVRIAAVEAPAK